MSTTSPTVLGLYETHLTVSDLARSIAFYRDVVGLELARVIEERQVAFFWAGSKEIGMLGLWHAGSGPMKMRSHLAFRMELDHIIASIDRLRAKGIEPRGFRGEPVDEPVVIGWMPAISLYFSDPDSHSIEFIAVLPETADASFSVQPYAAWSARG
ncbi:VOC family protein [Devosia nitrariae]|uniref:Fosmidomycin resistance protein n=1 Tax=Devosia nitrariae TaxID=2071872 RepID=A0ABQ5W5C0_9HYPH|nr:VOC family protein [Devosia nitrariae]GLQ55167.1 fosmidomycin resistance protein [Devosia nitrariae]